MLDPRMQPLMDVLVELVLADVRELENKNAAVAPTKENDNGVRIEREQYTSDSTVAESVRALRQTV